MKKIKTVFIVGPTASGKTDLGIKLAKELDGEIISADSMQIYKNIHIASAAPDVDEMKGVPHHLLEFLDTDVQFSVADYVDLAREKIMEINKRGKLPIIVGGTGLYINALLYNTEFLDIDTDYALRERLEKQFDEVGGEEMLKQLSKFDSETALRLHPNNRRRIIRAFEVYNLTGKTITEQNNDSHNNENFIEPIVFGITYFDREKLYQRINKRVDLMIESGLLEEAKEVFSISKTKGGFQAIGHKELFGYFKNEVSLDEALDNLKQQTRRYAKRQLTWFRKNQEINWFFPDENASFFEDILAKTKDFLKEE